MDAPIGTDTRVNQEVRLGNEHSRTDTIRDGVRACMNTSLSHERRSNGWKLALQTASEKEIIKQTLASGETNRMGNEPLVSVTQQDELMLNKISSPLAYEAVNNRTDLIAGFAIGEYFMKNGYHQLSDEQAVNLSHHFPTRGTQESFEAYKQRVEASPPDNLIPGRSLNENWLMRREILDVMEIADHLATYVANERIGKKVSVVALVSAAANGLRLVHETATDTGVASVKARDEQFIQHGQIPQEVKQEEVLSSRDVNKQMSEAVKLCMNDRQSPETRGKAWKRALALVAENKSIALTLKALQIQRKNQDPILFQQNEIAWVRALAPQLAERMESKNVDYASGLIITDYFLNTGYHGLQEAQVLELASQFSPSQEGESFDAYKLRVELDNLGKAIQGKTAEESWVMRREVLDVLEITANILEKQFPPNGKHAIAIGDIIHTSSLGLQMVHLAGKPDGERSLNKIDDLREAAELSLTKPAEVPIANNMNEESPKTIIGVPETGIAELRELQLSASENDRIFNAIDIHAPPYSPLEREDINKLGNRQLTAQELKDAGLMPKYQVKVEDADILISPAYAIEDRIAFVGYVKDGDRYVGRTYYLSQSQGVWRYLPAYSHIPVPGIPRFNKGHTEESITLPIAMQYSLNAILDKQQTPITVPGNPYFYFEGTARSILEKEQGTYLAEVGEIPTPLEGNLHPPERFNKGFQKVPPEEIKLAHPEKDSPEFSKIVATWEQTTNQYGKIQIEVYQSIDKKLQYMFCRDVKGRVWIGGVEDVSGKIQSVGLRSQWINAGDLVTPAYEYAIQVGRDEWANPKDSKGQYVDMYENYISKIPMIQDYLTYQRTHPRKAA